MPSAENPLENLLDLISIRLQEPGVIQTVI